MKLHVLVVVAALLAPVASAGPLDVLADEAEKTIAHHSAPVQDTSKESAGAADAYARERHGECQARFFEAYDARSNSTHENASRAPRLAEGAVKYAGATARGEKPAPPRTPPPGEALDRVERFHEENLHFAGAVFSLPEGANCRLAHPWWALANTSVHDEIPAGVRLVEAQARILGLPSIPLSETYANATRGIEIGPTELPPDVTGTLWALLCEAEIVECEP